MPERFKEVVHLDPNFRPLGHGEQVKLYKKHDFLPHFENYQWFTSVVHLQPHFVTNHFTSTIFVHPKVDNEPVDDFPVIVGSDDVIVTNSDVIGGNNHVIQNKVGQVDVLSQPIIENRVGNESILGTPLLKHESTVQHVFNIKQNGNDYIGSDNATKHKHDYQEHDKQTLLKSQDASIDLELESEARMSEIESDTQRDIAQDQIGDEYSIPLKTHVENAALPTPAENESISVKSNADPTAVKDTLQCIEDKDEDIAADLEKASFKRTMTNGGYMYIEQDDDTRHQGRSVGYPIKAADEAVYGRRVPGEADTERQTVTQQTADLVMASALPTYKIHTHNGDSKTQSKMANGHVVSNGSGVQERRRSDRSRRSARPRSGHLAW